jgi:hypothetical protein
MKRLRLLCFLVFIVVGHRAVFAAPVNSGQAAEAVSGWLRIEQVHLQSSLGQQISGVSTFTNGMGVPLYHVIGLAPDGFVITPADDLLEPVLCFSASGKYRANYWNKDIQGTSFGNEPFGVEVGRSKRAKMPHPLP